MPDSRIFEGKTTNEAIEKGLKELKVSKNDVEIKVIKDEDKRSFFDILAPRVVKVEIKLKEKREEVKHEVDKEKKKEIIEIDKQVLEGSKQKVMEFLDKFMETSVGEKVEYKCNTKENVIEIIIEDKKADFLIGYRGETLNALQTILTAVAVKDNSERIRVELDVLGYREKRKKALESLAEKIAKSVIRTRKSITLEPMTPYERKIIHSKLQNSNKVKTTSIGEGMHRKVVVSLK
ncbi:MAG: KH domain-containing protein [Clostridia bacterium]|nr:KH domain-containing protein [Clostridia bacterium]MCI9275115.1 KH domain-containing protein [Clostridia bacterium]